MNAPTDLQIIHGPDGKPAFVVMPYAQYVAQQKEPGLIPHGVVRRMVDGATPIRAWRKHLHLTQDEVAKRLEISQPAFAQQESVARPARPPGRKLPPSWVYASTSWRCKLHFTD